MDSILPLARSAPRLYTARMIRFVFLLLLSLPFLAGCSTVAYYSQAVGGHLSLLSGSRPVDEVLADDATGDTLAERLRLARRALTFAHGEMALPDNGSYRKYADVGDRAVTWSVVAAGRYSVAPKVWCYPFAGCVSYRGYFDRDDAVRHARKMRKKGWDVAVVGAAAYSTLGWFDDPLLSTMLARGESRIVEVLVHELAHQRFYIKGQTCINESFATAVASEGVRRWFAAKRDDAAYAAYLNDRRLRRGFNALLLETRLRLAEHYAAGGGEAAKAAGKKEIFAAMQADYRRFRDEAGDDRYDAWMAQDLNNAHLAQVATYRRLEPMFAGMIADAGGEMARFYEHVEGLRKKPGALPDCGAAGEEEKDDEEEEGEGALSAARPQTGNEDLDYIAGDLLERIGADDRQVAAGVERPDAVHADP